MNSDLIYVFRQIRIGTARKETHSKEEPTYNQGLYNTESGMKLFSIVEPWQEITAFLLRCMDGRPSLFYFRDEANAQESCITPPTLKDCLELTRQSGIHVVKRTFPNGNHYDTVELKPWNIPVPVDRFNSLVSGYETAISHNNFRQLSKLDRIIRGLYF